MDLMLSHNQCMNKNGIKSQCGLSLLVILFNKVTGDPFAADYSREKAP